MVVGGIGQALAAKAEAEALPQRDYIAEMREQARLEEQARKNTQADTNIAGVSYSGEGTPLSISLLADAQKKALEEPTAGTPQIDPVTGQPIQQQAYTPTYQA